ncbi:MAG: aminotransferase class IV [Candidatus Omnitrophica bacterium]|nr:aminotransferase class IV [Candidatus Omnitrophota bacterium]
MGVFETMRAVNNKIVYLEAHLERLQQSCLALGIDFPYPAVKLKKWIEQIVKINNLADAYIKLTLSQSRSQTDISIIARNYQPYPRGKYRQGFQMGLAQKRQKDYLLAQHKVTCRNFYETAYQAAKKRGLDEALILNSRGYIAEGTRSNIFLAQEKTLFTPALACGCLNGITRQVILDLAREYQIKAYTGNFTLKDLYRADEAFLTNSLIGVMPLTFLAGKRIGTGKCGKISDFFLKKYSCLLK